MTNSRPPLPTFVETAHGPSVEGASAELLVTLLDALETETRDSGVPIPMNRRSDWGAERIAAALGKHRLKAPDEVVAWFMWLGVSEPGQRGVPLGDASFPGVAPLDLEHVLRRYDRERAFVAPPPPPPPEYYDFGAGPGWIKLNVEPRRLAVECNGRPGTPPRIRYASEDFPYDPDRYRAVSLCTYVAWYLYDIRSGGCRWENDTWVYDRNLMHPTQVRQLFW